MHNCKMAQDQVQISGKCIIKNNEGKILILKKSAESKSRAGLWEFPGGKIDVDEDVSKGIRREVLEETGIKLVNISDEPLFTLDFEKTKNGRKVKVRDIRMYTAQASEDTVILSFEHTDYKWISLQEFKTLDREQLTHHTYEIAQLIH